MGIRAPGVAGVARLRRRERRPLNPARLLFPAIRWHPREGFQGTTAGIEAALDLGVGGFIVFGGPVAEVAALTRELRGRSAHPLLIGSDLERGAGQQFAGATELPPPAALGALGDPDAAWHAGRLTATEARSVGVDLVFAPVADLDLPGNPVVGTRSFGADPAAVAELVTAWVRGCDAGGALACVKHFPGHGRTRADSHLELPVVEATRDELRHDLRPFRAAIDAGVPAVMAAHVAYPALDASLDPASRSAPILRDLLRDDLRFQGLIVTDGLGMAGFTRGLGEAAAAVAAVRAGADLLLYPTRTGEVAAALRAATSERSLAAPRLRESLHRIQTAAEEVRVPPEGTRPGGDAAGDWAASVARRSLLVARGAPVLTGGPIRPVELDDDADEHTGSSPARTGLGALLASAGVPLHEEGRLVLAVYSEPRGWKGRSTLSPRTRAGVAAQLERDPDAVVVLFAHPRHGDEIPRARHLLVAWSGQPVMEAAAAEWLLGRGRAGG